MTHAFFKAVLFLAAGSVIIALHHEQDMRRMGGLKKYMPITYWTMLIGAISSAGIPGFAGFFSKDAIIEAVHHSATPGRAISATRACCSPCSSPRPTPSGWCSWRSTARALRRAPPAARVAARRHGAARPARDPVGLSGWVIGEVVFGNFFAESCRRPTRTTTACGRSSPRLRLGSVLARARRHRHGLAALPAGAPSCPSASPWSSGRSYSIVERKYGFDELYSWLFAGGAQASAGASGAAATRR